MKILKFNKDYQFYDSFDYVEKLPNDKTLTLQEGNFGVLFLSENPLFELPDKIYSNDSEFIDHVINSYINGTKSVGILLTGKKGLGKTFTAKLICQKLKLPTIVINKQTNDGMFDFLNKIEEEHVIFIDEFEKIFPLHPNKNDIETIKQEQFLSFLDGSSSSNVKRLFIITCNDSINEYLLNRPSRIRYLKSYNKIAENIIEEIVDDKLTDISFRKDLIDNLSTDELNVDSLIEIINEINITQKPYSYFKEFFNYKVQELNYSFYSINKITNDLEFIQDISMGDDELERIKIATVPYNIIDDIYLTKFIKEDMVGLIFDGYYYAYDSKNKTKEENKYVLRLNYNKMNLRY